MHKVEYYKKIGSDFPKIGFGFFMKYGQFSPKEKPTLITPDDFFCKQNNDRDKLLEMGHRDTLVFLKLAAFVNKILIEISCYKWIIETLKFS